MSLTPEIEKQGLGARTAARLSAVQALYQIEQSQEEAAQVIEEFIHHRFDGDADLSGIHPQRIDKPLFQKIVAGTQAHIDQINELLQENLPKEWPLDKLESVLRAILQAATFELLKVPSVPIAVLLNEYINITKAFLDEIQAGFANACLDRIAQQVRTSPQTE